MQQKLHGMDLDVTVMDGLPNVRICLRGQPVLETNALSCTGLQNLAGVLERAAVIAGGELDRYWRAQQTRLCTADKPSACGESTERKPQGE